MSALASALRRAGELLVEPAPSAKLGRATPLEVIVTGLGAGAGATTVARGLVHALSRLRPTQFGEMRGPGSVGAGPGTAVVCDMPAADAGGLCHRGAGRVVVAVADARRDPPLAALVCDVLSNRHDRVVLVANRVRDAEAWEARGALCVAESRLGVWLLQRGRRPLGAMGEGFDALAAAMQEASRS